MPRSLQKIFHTGQICAQQELIDVTSSNTTPGIPPMVFVNSYVKFNNFHGNITIIYFYHVKSRRHSVTAKDQERLAAEAEAKSTSWIATTHSLKMILLDKNG